MRVTRRKLFTDAKAPKDFTQQIIRREFTGDGVERVLRKAQLFSEQFQGERGGVEMRQRCIHTAQSPCQRIDVASAREDHIFARAFKARMAF